MEERSEEEGNNPLTRINPLDAGNERRSASSRPADGGGPVSAGPVVVSWRCFGGANNNNIIAVAAAA